MKKISAAVLAVTALTIQLSGCTARNTPPTYPTSNSTKYTTAVTNKTQTTRSISVSSSKAQTTSGRSKVHSTSTKNTIPENTKQTRTVQSSTQRIWITTSSIHWVTRPSSKLTTVPVTDKYLNLLFTVPDHGNMQGLAYAEGNYYIGFDRGHGMGQIDVVDRKGKLIKKTNPIPIEHAAELAYRKSDQCIYASNGNPDKTAEIYTVDADSQEPCVVHTILPSVDGYGALLAIDNDTDHMIISTNSDILCLSSHLERNLSTTVAFYTCNFKGKVLDKFSIPYQGVPQGIEYYKNRIYFYTDNKITVLSETGTILETYKFIRSGESEGLAFTVIDDKPELAVGYNNPGRVYLFDPFTIKSSNTD